LRTGLEAGARLFSELLRGTLPPPGQHVREVGGSRRRKCITPHQNKKESPKTLKKKRLCHGFLLEKLIREREGGRKRGVVEGKRLKECARANPVTGKERNSICRKRSSLLSCGKKRRKAERHQT